MSITDNTLELVKLAQSNPDDIIKSFVQPSTATTGLQAFNLEGPAKLLTPVLTPLRNIITRDTGGFAIQANWKAITDINVGNVRFGVAEGQRGGIITHAQSEYFAAFRGFGGENNVTFEAQYAAKNYDDLKARAVTTLLAATMVQEERLILGGNTSIALGTTPTPTLTTAVTGGTVPAATQSLICVALTLQAYLDVAGVNNGGTGAFFNSATSSVPGTIVRNNAGGGTSTFGGGSARQSVAATIVTTGATSTVTASVATVNAAVGYAWYMGVAGSERLVAVSSINSVVITAAASGSAQLASALGGADNSTSALDFDGLLTQAFKPGSNAVINYAASGVAGVGTGLTSDNAGGVVEFEAMFVQMYNRYRLSPTVIYVNPQELVLLSKKIVSGQGAPLLSMTTPANGVTQITAGTHVGKYMNKVTGDVIPIVVHPNMPAGTIFFYTATLPYALSGIDSVAKMLLRQDYYQLEWPLVTRRYDYGVYFDGVLQHYAPFSMGIITNLANL